MDFNATVDLIIRDLKEAGEIIDDLKNYQGVPLIQIELAKSKCRSAAEVIALLKSIKDPVHAVKENEDRKTEITEKVEPVKVVEKAETVRVIEKVEMIEIIEQVVEEVPEVKPDIVIKNKKKEPSSIFADKFSNQPGRLNEQIGSRREENGVSSMLKSKHVSNLRDAIGVNDRFLFIREIFNGSHESYDQAISKIETTATFSDARAVIMSYSGDNTENEVTNQLLELVKRKFTSHE